MTCSDVYWAQFRLHNRLDWLVRLLIIRTRSDTLRRLRAEPNPATTKEELRWLTEHFS